MKNSVPSLTSSKTLKWIKEKIEEVECDYQNTPGLILNETDLQCLLYRKLYDCFSEPQETLDHDIKAIALHTEIPWYDERGNLALNPDITLLDPQKMSIVYGTSIRTQERKFAYNQLPRKGFRFAGSAIIIEIKFVKRVRGISRGDIKDFKKDVEKTLDIIKRFNRPQKNEILGIIVIFNKTDKHVPEFKDFLDQYSNYSRLKIIYCTGKVDFETLLL